MRFPPARDRLPGWPELLAAIVEDRRDTPFAWGTHDCCLFAADVALAITGADPAATWRGTYATEPEAEAIMATAGGLAGFVAAALAAFGARECTRPSFAQRGDVALLSVDNEAVVGVVLDDRIAVPGLAGLRLVPRALATRAWAI